jgi:diaminopropionate ammonia-lyase
MSSIPHIPPALEVADIWDDYRATALLEYPELARLTKVRRVFVKAEWERPLGNFKSLGGMLAGLRALRRVAANGPLPPLICASDGNHGLAVAAAARHAGVGASIYLPAGVNQARVDRIEAMHGAVVRIPGTYDDAVEEAAAAAARGDGLLIPDTSEDLNNLAVRDVMAGYATVTRELATQFRHEVKETPSHLFVQAGVGGLAAAMAEGLRYLMKTPKRVLTVEPESAACVARALAVGRPVRITGNLRTSAEMLSCGLASAPAVETLKRHDARPVVVREEQLLRAVSTLAEHGGPATTPSGAAGFAGLLHVCARPDLRALHDLCEDSVVLLTVTEGPLRRE